MKKILFFIAGIWVSFMVFLVFRDQIDQVLAGSTEEPAPVVQSSEPDRASPQLSTPEVSVPKPVFVKEPMKLPDEEVPFAPLPEMDEEQVLDKEENVQVADSNKAASSMPVSDENNTENQLAVNLSNPFGLIITKFERLPSRFRLVSWKGNDLVQLEDLKKFNPIQKTFSRYWLEVGVPYVEWMNPVNKTTVFKPLSDGGSKPSIQAVSFQTQVQVLSYSNTSKTIGYVILKDYKIGGAPYEITNEMKAPLTSSYAVHCQQHIGANKYFHDLSGKRRGYKFGGWGYEFKINHFNFPERKITVTKKDLKTNETTQKIITAPDFSI